ncbi:hypothetical protein AB1Y20_005749 [Prymnesium parvum]|uniref:KOW domain-containing protein n=1 Tax=Prymnesium parvum TaxID=97485 RepID=A0AB34J2X8_PRYPA|mmetsp:Transcript_45859/g.105107  ORF Transcript_45859/g.105107 Transcript_45859/m.105107 type:complete len:247 (+) Transcript_45859:61-801(+)
MQIPVIPGFARLRQENASPSGSLSARLDRPRDASLRAPLTARPLGVTPRSTAMLGPRPHTNGLIGGEEAVASAPGSRSPRRVSPCATRKSHASDVHPTKLKGRCGGEGSGVEGCLQSPLASELDWLPRASGTLVTIDDREQGELVGPSHRDDEWEVRCASGATRRVPAHAVKRVAARHGDTARVVHGDGQGSIGVVLSIEDGRALIRSTDGARRVKLLPLDALAVLTQHMCVPVDYRLFEKSASID